MPVNRTFTDPASRIERVLERQERQFSRAFFLAIEAIRDLNTLEELASLLEQGRFEEALEGLEAAAAVLGNQYGASLSSAADDAAAFLSANLTVAVAFDRTNQRAVDAIRANRLRLVANFSNEQRRVTRAALLDGVERGLNPIDQARLFRDTIGLTETQEQAVRNFRKLLSGGRDGAPSTQVLRRALRDGRSDRSIQRAIRQGEPLSPEQIESMVSRYRNRYVKYRSEVIARTEALRATHEGTEEMYRQAIELGQFREDQLSRKWVTAGDSRVRDPHAALNGEVRPLGEGWETDGATLMYPGDPNAPIHLTAQCRCVISTRIVPPSENRNTL